MKRIRLSATAKKDLDEIWHYIATNSGSTDVADRWIDSIASAFLLFSRAPEAGTLRSEIGEGVRGFPVGNYMVYYRVAGSHIAVSRILHGMRDQRSVILGE